MQKRKDSWMLSNSGEGIFSKQQCIRDLFASRERPAFPFAPLTELKGWSTVVTASQMMAL